MTAPVNNKKSRPMLDSKLLGWVSAIFLAAVLGNAIGRGLMQALLDADRFTPFQG